MTKSELDTLESQIDELIESFHKVSLENASLRKKIACLNTEHANLLKKQKKATEALKKTITQVKDELYAKHKGNGRNKH